MWCAAATAERIELQGLAPGVKPPTPDGYAVRRLRSADRVPRKGVVRLVTLELLVALSALVFAPASSWVAARRGRNWALWLMYGIVIGPVALLIVGVAPPAVCPRCGSSWPGWAGQCAACSAAVDRSILGVAQRTGRSRPVADRDDRHAGANTDPDRDDAQVPRVPPSTTTVADVDFQARPPGGAVPGSQPAIARAPDPGRTPGVGMVLATGIFLGGSPSLTIGLPYCVEIRGERLVVTGPLTTTPGKIVVEQARDVAEVALTNGQVVITAGMRPRGRPEVSLIFGSIVTGRDSHEEGWLLAPAHPPTNPNAPDQDGQS